MALHRDIFWIGRQWAVTGFGMQTVNQKHGGEFDIPVERLWDDHPLAAVRVQKWFNPDDFSKGLEIARKRHPQPAPKPAALLPVEKLLRASAPRAAPEPTPPPVIPAVEAPPIAAMAAAPEPEKPPTPPPSFPEMRILSHPAKLLRVWRALRRRQ